MKTKIITLESHDDLISVRDKLSWAKTPRILLVWPKYEKIVLRVLDLKVLQRHADSFGAQLGLVTRRANVRRDAESLNIPVFDSTAAAQRDDWQASAPRSQRIPKAPRRSLRRIRDRLYEKEAPWRTSLLGRVIAFTVGVVAVLATASLFIPRATLILYPEAQTQTAVIPVGASKTVAAVSVTGAIPARTLSVAVSAEKSLAVANKISTPKSKSHGIARFKNLGQGAVNVLAGTIVSTATQPPVKFVVLHNTLLGAGANKFVEAPVEALLPGTSGNVPAKAIAVVEGPLSVSVSATNPNPIVGGADTQLIGATDEDRAKLRATVMDNLRRAAEANLRSQVAPADIFLLDTFEVAQIMEENFEPPAGQSGKTLVLKMKVEFSARYVLAADMRQLALVALNSSIPNGFEPFGEASFKARAAPATDASGVTHFELEVQRVALRRVNVLQVFSIARGRNPQAAKDELVSRLSLRQAPEITIAPSWWRWLPLIPFNIAVETR